MKPKLKLLSHFFEAITVNFPKFPSSPGKTIISKPKVEYDGYRSTTKLEVFAVKVYTTVLGKLRSGSKSSRFKVYVVAVAEFSVRDKKTKLTSSKLDASLRLEAVNLVQKTSLKKIKEILRSPYLSNIPFPASKITKTT
jgi:hypothetical protein